MKKDYRPVSNNDSDLSETAFVESYWTHVWEKTDAMNALTADIECRDEFKLVDPVLSSLPHGARILDGGCGLGVAQRLALDAASSEVPWMRMRCAGFGCRGILGCVRHV